jgi:hypothetical protein
MNTYQLREAMVGLHRDLDGQTHVITLQTSSLLTVTRNALRLQSGLVDALWEDRTVSVFIQDLKARGDLIRRKTIGL